MNYTQRHQELSSQFQIGIDTHLDTSNIDIRFFRFKSESRSNENIWENPTDLVIGENIEFSYPVFIPSEQQQTSEAILILHGLNERNWSKYLTWAEHLCSETGKAVILFPIAFHVNRSPQSWSNPRNLRDILDFRRKKNGEDRCLSFANVAFSERVCEEPYRFYRSGRQTVNDLTQLFGDIKQGVHPAFNANTNIDIFAYSIGAFLAEIILFSNPKNLFSSSKLFLFCGGGVFSSMFGQSRSIMDTSAYKSLFQYYLHEFTEKVKLASMRDKIFESFCSMISSERYKSEREQFFKRLETQLEGISLVKDKVMPYLGIEEALGKNIADSRITKMDFAFEYNHENPFPICSHTNSTEVDNTAQITPLKRRYNECFSYVLTQ